MSVVFEELEDSPRIHIREHGTLATRIFRVEWDDWQEFVGSLLGSYQIVGCSYLFVPPLEFPGLPNLVVSDVLVEPFDPENPEGSEVLTLLSGTNRYPAAGAKITVQYETLFEANGIDRADLPSVPEGTYLTFGADLGSEQVSTPGRLWKWDDVDAKKLTPDRNPQLLIPTTTYRLAWHRVVSPPWDAMRALRGAINGDTFAGAPAGTLLFSGARVRRQFQWLDGGGFWRVEYTFQERTVPLEDDELGGWNYFYDEVSAGWVKIKDGSGNPPYRDGDFSALFEMGTC